MKKLFRICVYFVVVILSLLIVLTIVAKLAEDKITNIALKKISESIEAPVTVDKVSFSLIRKFPLASIELNQVLLRSPSKQNVLIPGDTIISIETIYISVKSKPLLDGIIEVLKVDMDGAKINYFVASDSSSNIDFLFKKTGVPDVDTTAAQALNITLTNFTAKNIKVNYIDKALNATAKVLVPELKVKAKINVDNIIVSAKGEISLTDCSYGETNLYLMNSANAKFTVDYENDSIRIRKFVFNTDGAKFNLVGNVLLGKEYKLDLTLEDGDFKINELSKYAPSEMLKEYGVQNITGEMFVDASAKGVYSDTEMPRVNLTIDFINGGILTRDYPEIKNIFFKGKATNGIFKNNQSTQLNISSLLFETRQSKFDLAFFVLDLDKPKYDIKADLNVNVGEFRNYIPDSLIQSINGNIKAKISTKGELPDSIGGDYIDYVLANSQANFELIDFNIEIDSLLSIENFSAFIDLKPNYLNIRNLNVNIPLYHINLKNVLFDTRFTGSINNLEDISLNLKSYSIETEKSKFQGNAFVRNLSNPSYTFTCDIDLDLDEVKAILPDSLLNKLTGQVSASIESKGKLNLDSIADQAMDIVFNSSTIKMLFDHVSVELYEDTLYTLENFSGSVALNKDVVNINKVSGIVSGIRFGLDSTRIENVYKAVLQNKKELLQIDTRLNLGHLDYSKLLVFMPTTEVKDSLNSDSIEVEVKDVEQKKYSMLIKGAVKVRSFTYDKVLIEDISSLFNIQDSVYTFDQLIFNAFYGSMNTSVKYSIKSNNRSTIEMKNKIERMDIKKLLLDFDNFQYFYEPSITHENINGLFSTNLNSRFVLIGDSLIQEDMRIKGDIKLENGGVFNFEPAMELSKFTGIKELDNIQFKTLQSKIFIFKNSIYVPETYISSTAADITAYGMQSFGDDYEYHLKIHLGDILLGKSKKLMKNQAKLGDVADDNDRRGLYLLTYSLNGKSKNDFDKKKLQTSMQTKIKVQETMLNLIFHPGLVNFDTKVYSSIK